MTTGFETALGEITLVLFTTLAPSGVFAFMLMSVFLIGAPIDQEERRRINKALVIPLIVSLVGLVASATHLGNPANALYVFMGIGRSPLSTEVFFAVIFLMLTGVYWLYSFSEKQHLVLQKVWLGSIVVAGALFITAIAFAYDAETIISWNTIYVPLNLWLNALVGGPLLAFLSLQVALGEKFAEGMTGKLLCILSAVALVANTLSFCLQNAALPSIGNSFYTVADIVPFYGAIIAVFAILGACGIGIFACPLRKKLLPRLSMSILACFLVFAGIFLTRFAFYMMHLTVGLGV